MTQMAADDDYVLLIINFSSECLHLSISDNQMMEAVGPP